ncbi:MAG: N4-gp56 family major capsid protein [Nitrososphaera sp.]
MAATSYSVNHALAVKLWGKVLFREVLKGTDVGKFIGMDSNSLIQVRMEANKEAGDRITQGLRMQLTGAGVSGDGTMEGNEEELVLFSDNIFIDQLRQAVRSAGKMTEQRVTFSIREEARMGLQDWWMDRLATSFFNQGTGNVAQTDIRFTGMQAAITADASHAFVAGTGFTAGANVMATLSDTASDKMQLTHIDNIVAQAKTLTPIIRPVETMGVGKVHVMFLHPFQVKDLRTTSGTGTWQDLQKAALMGGQISKNPLFTGALGMYNNVVLHEDSRIPLGSDNGGTSVANTRMALFCGAQAVALAMGQRYSVGKEGFRMSWEEELFDYGNQYGTAAGMIFGMKKLVFNGLDFSTIRCATFAAAP